MPATPHPHARPGPEQKRSNLFKELNEALYAQLEASAKDEYRRLLVTVPRLKELVTEGQYVAYCMRNFQ